MVLDDTGCSKGFGFIRFNNETEQQTALTSMMGVSGLGGKPLKVRIHCKYQLVNLLFVFIRRFLLQSRKPKKSPTTTSTSPSI